MNSHPLLKLLAETPHAWLAKLLGAFQTGDIAGFNAVVGAHRAEFDALIREIRGGGAGPLSIGSVAQRVWRRHFESKSQIRNLLRCTGAGDLQNE